MQPCCGHRHRIRRSQDTVPARPATPATPTQVQSSLPSSTRLPCEGLPEPRSRCPLPPRCSRPRRRPGSPRLSTSTSATGATRSTSASASLMSPNFCRACDREEGSGGDQHHRHAALLGEGDLGTHPRQPKCVGGERDPTRLREVQGHRHADEGFLQGNRVPDT